MILHVDISVDITSLQVLDYKGNGGEGGIRTRPFFELSSCQGDGENPCEHGHSNTISFPSDPSNVAPFDCISEFLELMELMPGGPQRQVVVRPLR